MHDNRESSTLLGACLLSLSLWLPVSGVAEDPIVTKTIDGTFPEVVRNVRNAILGKGINIAHVLPASEMLNRTGPAFGYEDAVYLNAETIEFCSARISHRLARANPDNIVLCPFTISVYVLRAAPEQVRISYRIPVGRPGSEEAAKEVGALIESIIEDATW